MRLGELVDGLGVRLVTPGSASVRICDITEDSRTAMPGSLFVARGGRKADGRSFIMDAVRAGAVAILTDDADSLRNGDSCPNVAIAVAPDVARTACVLADRFYGRPSRALRLAAVTGTNGKTTTTWLLWKLLNAAPGRRAGLVGTVVVDDGVEVGPASMTTPPGIELARTLSVMAEAGCDSAVLEASSHALHQGRVCALSFSVGVFTNLTRDHLDYHASMEAYADAKALLFESLQTDAVAIVNADDPAWRRMVRACRAPVVGCSLAASAEAQVHARIVENSMSGMLLDVTDHRGDQGLGAFMVHVPLIGAYNAMNALQAAVAARAMGLTAHAVREGLAAAVAPPGRLERVAADDDGPAVFVDYAHTGDGLASVLRAVRGVMKSGRLWVVFGCGGDRDTGKRPQMGAVAAELADSIVVTSDNPRTERPGSIVDMILAGVPVERRHAVVVQIDRRAAIAHAIARAAREDVVVIAGKGHETEQIMPDGRGGTTAHHFDDRHAAAEALALRRGPARNPR